MRSLFSALLFLASTSAVAFNITSFDELNLGAGMGAQYSGLGVNVSATTAADSKYASLGCIAYSIIQEKAVCGVGIGWINTDWIHQQSNKHGLGVHLGLVGGEMLFKCYSLDASESPFNCFNSDVNSLYGVGFGYSYYSNGIDKPGAIYGISVHTPLKEDYFGDGIFLLQVGYQF